MMLGRDGWDFMVRHQPESAENHVDLPRMREGGLDAAFFSIYMPGTVTGPEAVKRALILIDHVRRLTEQHPNEIALATTAAEVRAANKAGRIAALMGMEGGHMIDDSLAVLREYQRLGVRYLTLSHSVNTNWSDSSGDTPVHNGLTDFGKDVVRELNRLGVMVDISHVSDKTFYDTLQVSRAPVIASHSSSRVLTNHPRNMTDEMLQAITRNGGVVMVNYYSAFVDENWRKAYEAQAKERNAAVDAVEEKYKDADPVTRYRETDKVGKEWAAKIPRPPFEDIIDHIDHVAKVAGIDHVGLGSDFDGTPSMPEGMDSAADLPKITEALVNRGYTAPQIRKILGGNLMRVFRQVEQVSKQLHAQQRQQRPPLARRMSSSH